MSIIFIGETNKTRTSNHFQPVWNIWNWEDPCRWSFKTIIYISTQHHTNHAYFTCIWLTAVWSVHLNASGPVEMVLVYLQPISCTADSQPVITVSSRPCIANAVNIQSVNDLPCCIFLDIFFIVYLVFLFSTHLGPRVTPVDLHKDAYTTHCETSKIDWHKINQQRIGIIVIKTWSKNHN